jgi:hypothetical protein
MSVTGSAKRRIVSDYIVWNVSVSSQRATPQAASTELAGWTREILAFLNSAHVEQSEITVNPITTETVNEDEDIYTRLPSLRPQLLADATRDALRRAQVLVESTGADLGNLRGVDVGVFQVTAPNSTEVEDYGVYDTSTRTKDVTAVVNVTLAID